MLIRIFATIELQLHIFALLDVFFLLKRGVCLPFDVRDPLGNVWSQRASTPLPWKEAALFCFRFLLLLAKNEVGGMKGVIRPFARCKVFQEKNHYKLIAMVAMNSNEKNNKKNY